MSGINIRLIYQAALQKDKLSAKRKLLAPLHTPSALGCITVPALSLPEKGKHTLPKLQEVLCPVKNPWERKLSFPLSVRLEQLSLKVGPILFFHSLLLCLLHPRGSNQPPQGAIIWAQAQLCVVLTAVLVGPVHTSHFSARGSSSSCLNRMKSTNITCVHEDM